MYRWRPAPRWRWIESTSWLVELRDAEEILYKISVFINHVKVYENGKINVKFEYTDEFRSVDEYIEQPL